MLAWSCGKEFVLCLQMPVLRVSMCAFVCVRACVQQFKVRPLREGLYVWAFSRLYIVCDKHKRAVSPTQLSRSGLAAECSFTPVRSVVFSLHHCPVCACVCKEHRLCFNYDVKQLHLNDTVSHAHTHATSFHCATALHNAVLFLPSSTS